MECVNLSVTQVLPIVHSHVLTHVAHALVPPQINVYRVCKVFYQGAVAL